jgi:hypothetical protein
MARKTTTLLPLSGANALDVTGDAVPGDSYYGYTDGVHTVAVYGNNLSGRIKIQGTLATTPTEDDWFDILIGGLPYKDYTSYTGVEGFTFVANLVFLRATLDRTSLGISDYTTAGHVAKIYLNY